MSSAEVKTCFLFGSGVSVPAGLPTVQEITESLFPDRNQASDLKPLAPNRFTEQITVFLRWLEVQVQRRYKCELARPVNYEDLYYLASQINDDLLGNLDNPAVLPLIEKAHSEVLPRIRKTRENADEELKDLADQTMRCVRERVCSLVSKPPQTVGHLDAFKSLPIVSSRGVKLGDTVFTLGFPNVQLQGFEPKLTKGEINGLAGAQDDPRHFQISAAIQPGNSGGPLVNLSGNVVGIVLARLADAAGLLTSGALPQNVNYALKSSYAQVFLESVPELGGKLKEPNPTKARKFDTVVGDVTKSVVLIQAY